MVAIPLDLPSIRLTGCATAVAAVVLFPLRGPKVSWARRFLAGSSEKFSISSRISVGIPVAGRPPVTLIAVIARLDVSGEPTS